MLSEQGEQEVGTESSDGPQSSAAATAALKRAPVNALGKPVIRRSTVMVPGAIIQARPPVSPMHRPTPPKRAGSLTGPSKPPGGTRPSGEIEQDLISCANNEEGSNDGLQRRLHSGVDSPIREPRAILHTEFERSPLPQSRYYDDENSQYKR